MMFVVAGIHHTYFMSLKDVNNQLQDAGADAYRVDFCTLKQISVVMKVSWIRRYIKLKHTSSTIVVLK